MTVSDAPTQGHYVEVNGLQVYYEECGQGIPLLLVHAGSVTSASWNRWIPHWANQYPVIAPDSRGHGKTVDPTGHMRIDLMAEDVASLVTALDLERPLLVGWSDGGHIVLEVAMRCTVAVRAVVAGGLEVTPERAREHLRAFLHLDQHDRLSLDHLQRENPGYVEWIKQQQSDVHDPEHRKTYVQQWAEMELNVCTATPERLAQIAVPVLFLQGDRDDAASVEEMVEVYRATPTSELAITPGADHLFPWNNPELFEAIVTDFLHRHHE